jgi:hypothetical protein
MWNRQSKLTAAAVAVAIALGAGGCGTAGDREGSLGGQDAQPAKLIRIPGSTVAEVVLTPSAAAQIGVEQTQVSAANPAAPTETVSPIATPSAGSPPAPAPVVETVPVTATIYDPEGKAWTYTVAGVRTYLRVPITVDHVADGIAYLTSGPPVGTVVVSQGAPELLGVEYGVGEE